MLGLPSAIIPGIARPNFSDSVNGYGVCEPAAQGVEHADSYPRCWLGRSASPKRCILVGSGPQKVANFECSVIMAGWPHESSASPPHRINDHAQRDQGANQRKGGIAIPSHRGLRCRGATIVFVSYGQSVDRSWRFRRSRMAGGAFRLDSPGPEAAKVIARVRRHPSVIAESDTSPGRVAVELQRRHELVQRPSPRLCKPSNLE